MRHRALQYLPTAVAKIVNACVILHMYIAVRSIRIPEQEEEKNFDYGIYAPELNDEVLLNTSSLFIFYFMFHNK